jgi:hypothetical protein
MARRHKMALILPALVTTVACGLAIWFMPVEYISSAAIIAEPSKTDGPRNQAPDLILNHLRGRATERTAVIGLIDDWTFRNTRDKDNQESIVTDVRPHRVDLEPGPISRTRLQISFRAPDPETAQRVTALRLSALSEGNHGDLPGASAEIESLRKRTNDLFSKLRELERKGPRFQAPENRFNLRGSSLRAPPNRQLKLCAAGK